MAGSTGTYPVRIPRMGASLYVLSRGVAFEPFALPGP
jgi:hypothetical protein